ncbi:hypothetical protein QL285_096428 [Trifolium repens]|nr:hypothetical protein QL285_096428 [Trifolium repens]
MEASSNADSASLGMKIKPMWFKGLEAKQAIIIYRAGSFTEQRHYRKKVSIILSMPKAMPRPAHHQEQQHDAAVLHEFPPKSYKISHFDSIPS